MPPWDAAGFLRASPVFTALPAKELEALAAAARGESHRAREYVFMEGDPSHWLYIVTEAVRRLRLAKRATCHTFRHSFATHLLSKMAATSAPSKSCWPR
jgi:integrase